MTNATVGSQAATPLGINDVNGVSGTIAWWTMTECSLGNITCNLPIISGYIFQRFFRARVTYVSSHIVTIGRKSLRLNPVVPPDLTLDLTLDQTMTQQTRAVAGTEDGISPSTVDHVESSPLEIPRGQT
ncbi:uncharacterized protein PG986_013924 [Apiospora aurea]|uniref:Uncharacterized protein n=1 Tax=Apiospora aurea TaxID=335848 RepID=A0ABR1PWX9_9PEZI